MIYWTGSLSQIFKDMDKHMLVFNRQVGGSDEEQGYGLLHWTGTLSQISKDVDEHMLLFNRQVDAIK